MTDTLQYVIKKYGIDVGRQYIVDIDNMDRDEMATMFAELNFNKGAEIGVERGYYSEVLCGADPSLHLLAVDPWSASVYEPGIHGVDTDQNQYDQRYAETVERLKPYNCTIVRKTSMDAVKEVPDESLDFVYIDGNHEFSAFINDLHQWRKKVRMGGIISGHDYADYAYHKFNHVKRAVQAYTRAYGIVPMFIVGGHAIEEGKKRDKFRSWFFVKDK